MYKIFIVEDDEIILKLLKKHLSEWGYKVEAVKDFKNIKDEISEFSPHLVLMDISLPFYNGFYWCNEIRKNSNIPIIFISSVSDNMNIVMAINMGGDDFISKPFDLSVATAKIQALLRRTYDFMQPKNLLVYENLSINLGDYTVKSGDKILELTKNELKILCSLIENKGKVTSRDKIMEALWQTDSFVDENTLSVNIARLRKKLSSIGLENLIVTKKGLGYMVGL